MTDSKTKEPWTTPEDLLERKQEADFLENYLKQASNDPASSHGRGSFVINLKGQWGTGKTYFLKNFAQQLRNSNHKVVEFDAWRADPNVDPLISLIAAIKTEIEPDLKEGTDIGNYFEAAVKSGGKLLKQIGFGLFKRAGRIVLGESLEDIADIIVDSEADFVANNEDTIDNIREAIKEEANSAIETAKLELAVTSHFSKQLQAAQAQKTAIKTFSDSFEKIARTYAERDDCEGPFYIFVDELDRCRPTFAIEVLERINHLFDVKGVVFVVGTDSDELEHSIKAVYGSEFNSAAYLNRFFSFTYNLSKPHTLSLVKFLTQKYSIDMNRMRVISPDATEQEKQELIFVVMNPFISNVRDYFHIFFLVKTAQLCWPEERNIDLVFVFFCAILVFNRNEEFLHRINRGVDGQIDDYKTKCGQVNLHRYNSNTAVNLGNYISAITSIIRDDILVAYRTKYQSQSILDGHFSNMLKLEIDDISQSNLQRKKSIYSQYIDILKTASKLTIPGAIQK